MSIPKPPVDPAPWPAGTMGHMAWRGEIASALLGRELKDAPDAIQNQHRRAITRHLLQAADVRPGEPVRDLYALGKLAGAIRCTPDWLLGKPGARTPQGLTDEMFATLARPKQEPAPLPFTPKAPEQPKRAAPRLPTCRDVYQQLCSALEFHGIEPHELVAGMSDDVARRGVLQIVNGYSSTAPAFASQTDALASLLGCDVQWLRSGNGEHAMTRGEWGAKLRPPKLVPEAIVSDPSTLNSRVPRCSADTLDGRPCVQPASVGSDVCRMHSNAPEDVAARTAHAIKGGQVTGRGHGRGPKGTPEQSMALRVAIVEELTAAREPVSALRIALDLHEDEGRVRYALVYLMAEGVVAKIGERRGARYTIARADPVEARGEAVESTPAATLAVRRVAFDGADLSVQGEGDETRMRDLDLARVLGFGRDRDIRRIIKRLIAAGKIRPQELRAVVSRSSTDGQYLGQAEVDEFWLTRLEAVIVATHSNLPNGQALRAEMEKAYSLATEGKLPGQQPGELTQVLGAVAQLTETVATLARDVLAMKQLPALSPPPVQTVPLQTVKDAVREVQQGAPRGPQLPIGSPRLERGTAGSRTALTVGMRIQRALRECGIAASCASVGMGRHPDYIDSLLQCITRRAQALVRVSTLQKMAVAIGCRPEFLIDGRGPVILRQA